MVATFSDFANVFKLRIGVAIMGCALAGFAVTRGETLAIWQVVVLALSILASSAAADAFNQYAERALDARMPRTARRPFADGTIQADWRSVQLVMRPGPQRAMSNFFASLAQLGLLLFAAMAEGWLAG